MRNLCALLFLLIFIIPGFSSSRNISRLRNNNNQVPVYQFSKRANKALKSFIEEFYNPEKQLFYSSTEKNDLAAIWTQAIYLEMMIDAFEQTHDSTYYHKINAIISGGYKEYDKYNWNNKKVWFIYDDMMWWINALARAYKVTGKESYLRFSQSGFKRVWDSAYDKVNGGMFWQFKRKAKNACINYPTVIAALRIYGITKDTAYLHKAKLVYQWARKNLFDKSSGRVGDHKLLNQPIGWEDYTYNQGTCIGASVLLYQITQNQLYLKDAKLAANYVKNEMCNKEDILPAEGSWNEQGVLKTIFFHYMKNLLDAGQTQYIDWLKKNANLAWSNRCLKRNIMYRDYTTNCPDGVISSYDASSGVQLMLIAYSKNDISGKHDSMNYLTRNVILRKGDTLIFINKYPDFNKTMQERLIHVFFKVYPKEMKRFNPAAVSKVTFIIDPSYKGVAATSGATVHFNPQWFKQHPEDIDVVTHEVMHIVQAYHFGHTPGWLVEGIADYVRYIYGINNKKAGWAMPDYSSKQSYENSYRITARFLAWVNKKIDKSIVVKLDAALRNGTYKKSIWKKLTGKTIEQLWHSYSQNPTLKLKY